MTTFPFRALRLGALRTIAALALACTAIAAAAQGYPSKPITMYIPFPPGGATDALMRVLAPALGKQLNQAVVIENLSGAGGTIGMSKVANANPDGYSLLFNNVAQSVAATMFGARSLDPIKSFEPVGMVAFVPMVLVAGSGYAPNSLQEVLAEARITKISIATSGLGSATQLCSMLLMNATKTQMMPVPYKGAGPAIIDVLANRVDLLCDQPPGTAAFINSGKMKAYAIATKTRLAILPDVPTFAEAGLSNFEVASWHGIYAPKGTPAVITTAISTALQAALQDPALIKSFDQIGAQRVTSEQATPSALRDYLRADIARWTPLIKDVDKSSTN